MRGVSRRRPRSFQPVTSLLPTWREAALGVTRARREMAVVDIPEPGDPGPGEVLVRPEAVGLCGSDFHYYLGDISAVDDSERFPRTQGHEIAAVVESAGSASGLEARNTRRDLAGSCLRLVLPVSDRASQCLRQHPADWDPLRRSLAGAGRSPGDAGFPCR